MNHEIKKNEQRERTRYVPASVKVIEFTSQSVLCQSTTQTDKWIDDIE